MTLNKIIKKFNISFSSDELELCEVAIEQMKKSVDPLHGVNHIQDIFGLLDRLITETNSEEDTENIDIDMIDFSILLPAICWHDVWKSQQEVTTSLIRYKVEQYYDGLGSYRLFNKHTKKTGLSKEKRKKIGWVILKHGGITKYKQRQYQQHHDIDYNDIEVKILIDLDTLDLFNVKRLERVEGHFLDKHDRIKEPKHRAILKWAVKYYYAYSNPKLYFTWSQAIYFARRYNAEQRLREVLIANNINPKSI